MNHPEKPPPPDPGKVTVQVLVDVVCLVLSVAAAILVSVRLAELGHAEDPVAAVLTYVLPVAVFVGVVALGVAVRAWVRGVFGVADTGREEKWDDAASEKPVPPDPEEDDVSEPTVCLVCRTPIPAGAAQCPRCGWTYRPRS